MSRAEGQFAMSLFASKQDRADAINRAIDRAARKRDVAADRQGNIVLAMTYQQEIDDLLELLGEREDA